MADISVPACVFWDKINGRQVAETAYKAEAPGLKKPLRTQNSRHGEY